MMDGLLARAFATPAGSTTVFLLLCHHVPVLVYDLASLVLAYTGWLAGRKLQGRFPPRALVLRSVAQLLVEGLLVLPLLGYWIIAPLLLRTASPVCPAAPFFVIQVVALLMCTDAIFYWAHRTLHWGPLYRAVHKQHHEFKVVAAVAAEYSHPVETLLNVISVLAVPAFLGPHIWVTGAVLFLRMWESVDCHCNYDLPLWLSPWGLLRTVKRHDFHHSRNIGSYGMFSLWDIALGTGAAYEEWARSSSARQ